MGHLMRICMEQSGVKICCFLALLGGILPDSESHCSCFKLFFQFWLTRLLEKGVLLLTSVSPVELFLHVLVLCSHV